MSKEIVLSQPLSHQAPLLDSPKRFKIARWGRRAGKTDTSETALIIGHGPLIKYKPHGQRVTTRPMFKGAAQGGHMLWLAPSYPQSATIWERALVPMCGGVPGVILNEAKKTVMFPGGGSIMVRSAEAINNIRGMSFDGVVIDEAAYLDLKSSWLSVIFPTLTDRMGWAIIISTPHLGSYFNFLCQKEIDGQSPTWGQFHARSMDNTSLPQEALDALIAEYIPGSSELLEEVHAELITERGALFNADYFKKFYTDVTWQDVLCPDWSDKRIPFRDTLLIVDLAASLKQSADYTVVMAAGVTDTIGGVRRAAILDVQRQKIEGPDQIKLVGEQIRLWRPTKVLVETVGYQLTAIQHLRKAFPNTTFVELKPKGDKRQRALGFAAALSRGEVAFPKNAPWLAEYIKEHVVFTGDGKRHDDMVDVGSYLALYTVKARFTARPRLASI